MATRLASPVGCVVGVLALFMILSVLLHSRHTGQHLLNQQDRHGQRQLSTVGSGHSLHRSPPSASIPVVAFVMSKCPDAVFCESALTEVLEEVGEIVDFELQYIGFHNASEKYGVACKHGDSECLGNIYQLCARHYYPSASQWFNFVTCQNEDIARIPTPAQIAACAERVGMLDYERTLRDCAEGPIGRHLLHRSITIKEHAKAIKSCTIYINYEKRCIRDGGKWYDCPGGSEGSEFVRSICDLYNPGPGGSKPKACAGD